MTKWRAALVIAVAASVFSAPVWAQRKIEEIAARVNNEIILKSELDKELKQLQDEIRQSGASAEQREEAFAKMSKDVLRNLIDVALLNQVAKEQDVACEAPVARRLDEIRRKQNLKDMDEFEKFVRDQGLNMDEVRSGMCRDYNTQEVINREVAARIVISTQEMRQYYDEHKDDFKREAGIQLGEIGILLKNGPPDEQRKKAEDIQKALKAGEDFGDQASRFSDTPSAERGGDVGFLFQEDFANYADDLVKAISKLEKGQISDIVVRPEGFLIWKILDKHTGGVLSFDLAQNEIYSAIIAKRLPGKVREYLDKLRLEGFVDVKEGYVDTGAVKKSERASNSKDKDKDKNKDKKN
jgi:peptidyl-prolyl cis-trans isomerase SurA